ncbi:MAG: hypothetical protein ACJ8AW_34245 [Rhodopila sp.]
MTAPYHKPTADDHRRTTLGADRAALVKPIVTRRAGLGLLGGLLGASRCAGGATLPHLRLGILQFGTEQWLAEVIRKQGFDTARDVALETQLLANTDAGRVAIRIA